MKQLSRFTISHDNGRLVLRLESAGGEVAEYAAEPEQLDEVIDALDDLLSGEDADVFPGLSNGAALQRH